MPFNDRARLDGPAGSLRTVQLVNRELGQAVDVGSELTASRLTTLGESERIQCRFRACRQPRLVHS